MTIKELSDLLKDISNHYGDGVDVSTMSCFGESDNGFYDRTLTGVKLLSLKRENLKVTMKQNGQRIVVLKI